MQMALGKKKTFCCFYLFSLKEEIAISFLVNNLTVHSFIHWANKCLFSVYLMLVCVGYIHLYLAPTHQPSTMGDFSWPISAHTASTWLLFSLPSFPSSFSSLSFFSFFSRGRTESSYCYWIQAIFFGSELLPYSFTHSVNIYWEPIIEIVIQTTLFFYIVLTLSSLYILSHLIFMTIL